MNKKEIQAVLDTHGIGWKLSSQPSKGTFTIKQGYYWGITSDAPYRMADRLREIFNKIDIVQARNDFRPWPKDSNWVVIFRVY